MPPSTLEIGRSVRAVLLDGVSEPFCFSAMALSLAGLASHTTPNNSLLPKGTRTKVPIGSISALSYDNTSANPLCAGVWTITETK